MARDDVPAGGQGVTALTEEREVEAGCEEDVRRRGVPRRCPRPGWTEQPGLLGVSLPAPAHGRGLDSRRSQVSSEAARDWVVLRSHLPAPGFQATLTRLPAPSLFGDDTDTVLLTAEHQSPSRLRFQVRSPPPPAASRPGWCPARSSALVP